MVVIRFWRALSNAEDFGTWFGVDLKGQSFAAGKRTRGLMNDSCGHDDDEVWFDVVVERIEPQNVFSYRWHPYAVDPAVNYAEEQSTLVVFTLKEAPEKGILLTVVESGFDNVPPHRRLEAFRMHTNGWEAQLKNVANHVSA
ncbi:MAG: SRPBCC family protein [Cellvibrio sp.]